MSEDLGREGHLEVAERFLEHAQTAAKADGDLRAWSIVMAFYAAVHWVRAYIQFKAPNARIASHEDVRDYFRSLPELRRIKPSYDTLKQSSQSVRYYGQLSWDEGAYDRSLKHAAQVRAWAVPKCKVG